MGSRKSAALTAKLRTSSNPSEPAVSSRKTRNPSLAVKLEKPCNAEDDASEAMPSGSGAKAFLGITAPERRLIKAEGWSANPSDRRDLNRLAERRLSPALYPPKARPFRSSVIHARRVRRRKATFGSADRKAARHGETG